MPTKTIQVKLVGKGQLHQPVVKLEGIAVNLWSPDNGLTWENPGVQLDITGTLEIFMSCKAMSGTKWEFFVKDKAAASKCYEAAGQTGDSASNYSERTTSVNC